MKVNEKRIQDNLYITKGQIFAEFVLEALMSMMQKISEIIQDTKVQIMQPLLAEEFITYARNLPLYGKIRGSDDMLRKHAIRDLALKIGVPEISARKRKKALQYGTLIHKNLIKSKLLRE